MKKEENPQIARMMADIETEYLLSAPQTGHSIISDAVRKAMMAVPRDDFVPSPLKSRAFDNNALPIGDGQTISQPFIVALMTDLLRPQKDHVILEVGTGSGYQAAVLAELAKEIYSLEILPGLARESQERLRRLGYGNVTVLVSDGSGGWPAAAPYDGIIVTAAAPFIPDSLKQQLKPGGRLVIPVGLPYHHQELMVLEKSESGRLTIRSVLGVAFVPLTGKGKAT